MDIQFPSFLQKGDKVVIVSPSSKIDQQFLKGAKKRIESWGLKVAMGKYAGSSSGRYLPQRFFYRIVTDHFFIKLIHCAISLPILARLFCTI